MNTENIRLNITIPKDLFTALNQCAGPRKKSRFIAQAIRKQIELQQKQALDKALEEGYRAAARENLIISDEFEAADLEGWDDY